MSTTEASERASVTNGFVTVPRGLAKVLVTDTELGDVRGEEGFYHYRQYSAIDLATSVGFETAWYLFVHGQLPDDRQLMQFRGRIGELRALPEPVLSALPMICRSTPEPLQVLRTAVSLLGSELGLRPLYDCDQAERVDSALRLAAATPTILAAARRLERGLEPISPDRSLTHTEDYLRMVTGRLPAAKDARAIEQYLTATIDHGFNASTFTARVVASTGADLAACLVAAVGSFSGPLHGGAPSRALQALDEIGSAERAEDYVRTKLAAGARIMGFGHAVYRTTDPRSKMLKEIARSYHSDLGLLAEQVEATVERILNEVKPDRPLHTNVEYYAGVVLKLAGLEPAMFTPTFCVARVVGWVANILEQARDPKIIRPSARYVGPPPPAPLARVAGAHRPVP